MKVKMYGRDITGQFVSENYWKRVTAKAKKMWYWTKVFLGVGFVGAVIGGFIVGAMMSTTVSYVSAEENKVIVDTMPAKIDSLKDEVLADLAKCESGGKKEEDGIVILDTNNVGSYGTFQFQKTTVMHYFEKMTGQKINGRDAILLALDAEKSKELAKFVVFSTKNGVEKDWVNCSRKHGLQARVDIIKNLEK